METPWALREKVNLLAQSWNELHAQVYGRSVYGRDDIADAVQKRITKERNKFRSWVVDLMKRPFIEVTGQYEDEFRMQVRRYTDVRDSAARELPEGEELEAPENPIPEDWTEYIPAAVGTAVVVGILLIWKPWK